MFVLQKDNERCFYPHLPADLDMSDEKQAVQTCFNGHVEVWTQKGYEDMGVPLGTVRLNYAFNRAVMDETEWDELDAAVRAAFACSRGLTGGSENAR